jgi:hypothetical protein
VLFYLGKEEKMKRLFQVLLSLLLILCLFCPITALADTGGSGNIDGGGGGMGSGSDANYWNSGNEGVRITVVRASDHAVVTTPIDFTNITPPSSIYHFGKVSKIQYNNGATLQAYQGGYTYKNPGQTIPRIISSNGTNNIDAIKSYFCSEYVVKRIAEETGMNYDVLISGDYKILLEPIAYFTFQGAFIATTATEAALYDQQVNGLLRSWMQSLTHKNLPLAMFLEVSDLGYPAWSGSRTTAASDADIISSMGLGIVRFNGTDPEPFEVDTIDYEYRVNTEVITAVTVSGGQSDPDNPVSVRFNIGGTTYTVSNVYYPSGDSQLAWVKWTTPDTEQDMVITVMVTGSGSTSDSTINVRIVDLDKNVPPNPVADDRNNSFSYASVPDRPQKSSASWSVWRPWWHENWVWYGDDENGYWADDGWWEFDFDRYTANLTSSMSIVCDTKNPTANGRIMKSGYGINQTVTGSVTSTQSSAVTQPQNAVSYFPEFGYETYWRLLEQTSSGRFEFQKNPYSTYKDRTHFTPIWMPDGAYTVNTWLIDAWTPVGMLSANLTDSLTISGNLWQDWHIAPLKP